MPATLDSLTEDFRRIKQQKARVTGGIEGRVLLNLGFVLGEQYLAHRNNGIFVEKQEKNRLYLVFNMIAPRVAKLLGRLSSTTLSFRAQPDKKDPASFAEAEVVTKLDKALDQKLNQPARLWETLWWMAIGGTAFVYTPWVPDSTVEPVPKRDPLSQEPIFRVVPTGEEVPGAIVQQALAMGAPKELFEPAEEAILTGEIGCEVLGPLNVFIDQGVRSIEDLAPDQYVYIARIKTLGWVKANFPEAAELEGDKEFQIVSTQFHQLGDSVGGHHVRDLIPLVQGQAQEGDPPMVTLVEAFQPASMENPQGRYVVFVPGKKIIRDVPNPYGEIPLVDFHWKPVTTSFWTADYVTDLIAPQRFLNRRLSQMGEQSNASVYGHLMTGGTIKASDIPADYPGVIEGGIAENGTPLVGRLAPPEFPTWFFHATTMVQQMFNDIAGGADLFRESKFPGQLRGPMAVPMLQEILDTEWGPLFEHIGERMAKVKQQRLNRVKKFYPPARTLHYVDRNQKNETMDFHKDEILGKGTNFNITIERSSLLPELRALKEMRLMERLNSPLSVLYMDERTGMWDKQKIANELQFGETGRESKEQRHRKFATQIIEKLFRMQPVPPVMPFYDHNAMLDELEAQMTTEEFMESDPRVQQAFIQRYEQHRAYLIQEAQAQQMQMQQGAIHNAVAQATQQAAAQAAALAVEQAMQQSQAQQQQPTDQFVQESREMVGKAGR